MHAPYTPSPSSRASTRRMAYADHPDHPALTYCGWPYWRRRLLTPDPARAGALSRGDEGSETASWRTP